MFLYVDIQYKLSLSLFDRSKYHIKYEILLSVSWKYFSWYVLTKRFTRIALPSLNKVIVLYCIDVSMGVLYLSVVSVLGKNDKAMY